MSIVERGSADDDQFRRLDEHEQVAVLHEIATYDGAKDNDNPDDGKHDSGGGSVEPCPRKTIGLIVR
jgi:hypothetical protein